MKRLYLNSGAIVIGLLALCFMTGCGGIVNTNADPNFDDEGYLVKDSTDVKFERKTPSAVNFFVEVSGSMNGFFRANKTTQFKTDVWNVLSSFSNLAPNVNILTNDGSQGATMSLADFRTSMNTGAFISSASTRVPTMLQTILGNLNADEGEVAVLISDMKYSPVGAAAPAVLMSQYSTDINRILGQFGKSISVVCATSDYLDKQGNTIADRSPYYFVILGNQENVAEVRNYISLLLKMQGHYVENIDSGFNYGRPEYSFGITNKCYQLDNEATFIGYEEAEPGDTCTIKLKVPIENYRWLMENEEVFRNAFKAQPKYGSNCEIGKVEITVKDITGANKRLNREAYAVVDMKIFDMATDSEVIEWTLDLPVTEFGAMEEFFIGADDENDPTKSYSVLDFLRGVFQGGLVVHDMKPNYILVSKKQ